MSTFLLHILGAIAIGSGCAFLALALSLSICRGLPRPWEAPESECDDGPDSLRAELDRAAVVAEAERDTLAMWRMDGWLYAEASRAGRDGAAAWPGEVVS